MIDPSLRDAAVRTRAPTRTTAAILFDVVLGFGSHDDPARGLAQALADAQREARAQGRTLALIGHVCGTDGDPQDKAAQVRQLEAAGAHRRAAMSRRRCWRRISRPGCARA